jgi:hypothetical protein
MAGLSPALGRCPACGGEIRITGISCSSCRTRIETDIAPCLFCTLEPELLLLLRVFLRSRGNIRQVERQLGISYPTVKKRLGELLLKLGLDEAGTAGTPSRADVFDRLRKGEITVDDAVDLLGGAAP